MSERLYVATRKGLFTFEKARAGQPWTVARAAFLGDPVSMVLPDPRDGTVYAALNLGHFGVKLRRSRDGGETWAECAAPAYAEEAQGVDGERSPNAPSVTQIWSLEAGGSREPGVLWAGTIPGGLFRSRDGSESWELMRSLWDRPEREQWFGGGYDKPGIHSICVDPRDSRRLVVGVSCGGVWVTEDAGNTWALRARGMFAAYMPPERKLDPGIQDPHRIVQCAGAPDVYWAQHHNGVFRSSNGCESWDEIAAVQPSVFGFAVAVHPRTASTAWFIPAVKDECRIPVDGHLVVSRTRDGGKSFEVLREGLPGSHAYHLVYRHGLDIDESGNRLAFGSTTGGLWTTENQGDSWQCASAHLPPIYCVRYARRI